MCLFFVSYFTKKGDRSRLDVETKLHPRQKKKEEDRHRQETYIHNRTSWKRTQISEHHKNERGRPGLRPVQNKPKTYEILSNIGITSTLQRHQRTPLRICKHKQRVHKNKATRRKAKKQKTENRGQYKIRRSILSNRGHKDGKFDMRNSPQFLAKPRHWDFASGV